MKFDNLNEFLDVVRDISKSYILYIWGSGIYGNLLGKLFDKNKIEWKGYFNNYDDIGISVLNDKPIYNGKYIDTSDKSFYILAMRNYDVVKEQLISGGISEENIIFFDNVNILNSIGNSAQHLATIDKIKSFNNLYKRQECFVIGNGPSLCIDDLDKIYSFGKISFASNMIFKCYEKTSWRPDYYFAIDGNIIRTTFNNVEILDFVSKNCKYMFSRCNGLLGEQIKNVSNLILFNSVYSNSEQQFDFSSDCAKQIYIGYTVTYAMLQMAIYMGFTKIYLLGMDHNASVERGSDGSIIKHEGVKDHSEILGNYAGIGVGDFITTSRAYVAAKKYAEEHGVKIYNATRGGKLEVFERVNFDELF